MKNEELINLQGGYDYPPGTCAWQGGGGYSHVCNTTREYVEYWSKTYGGNWCCDNCATSSWWPGLCG